MKVERYVEPSEFDRWKEIAEGMGFLYVASGPLVRSSYKVILLPVLCLPSVTDMYIKAGEYFIENVLRGKGTENRAKSMLSDPMTNETALQDGIR